MKSERMRLGFFSAIVPELSLEQVLEFATRNHFAAIEVACWPEGKGDRRFAGVTHLDVTSLSETQADEVNALCAKYGVSMSALGYYPNPLDPDPVVSTHAVAHL